MKWVVGLCGWYDSRCSYDVIVTLYTMQKRYVYGLILYLHNHVDYTNALSYDQRRAFRRLRYETDCVSLPYLAPLTDDPSTYSHSHLRSI